MLGFCDKKHVTDGLNGLQLYRNITATDANANAAFTSAKTAPNSGLLNLTWSLKGSTNIIYVFLVAKGNAATTGLGFSLWLCLNGQNPSLADIAGTPANLFVKISSYTAATTQQMYTFTGLMAAGYVISMDAGTVGSGSWNMYTAMTGPTSDYPSVGNTIVANTPSTGVPALTQTAGIYMPHNLYAGVAGPTGLPDASDNE
jgi:hypothetical protein